jgi:hypothetical protein
MESRWGWYRWPRAEPPESPPRTERAHGTCRPRLPQALLRTLNPTEHEERYSISATPPGWAVDTSQTTVLMINPSRWAVGEPGLPRLIDAAPVGRTADLAGALF